MAPKTMCETAPAVIDLHADDHVDPPYSHIAVGAIMGLLGYCLLMCLVHKAKSNRLAQDTDQSENPEAPITEGVHFVSGKVEFARDQTQAISVQVEQSGSERQLKDTWTHEWKETGRNTQAQPFYIRRPNGVRIRVEPGSTPLLVDKPTQTIVKQNNLRTRIANLEAGTDVVIQGQLTKASDPESEQSSDYRSNPRGWVMVPANGGRMEVSVEKLGERHRKRAASFKDTFFALLWYVLIITGVYSYYHVRLFAGEDTCAKVVKKEEKAGRTRKGLRAHKYSIDVQVDAPNAPISTQSLEESDWEGVSEGSVLAFRQVSVWPSMSIVGSSVSIHPIAIFFGTILGLAGWATYNATGTHRRWYDGRLDERGDGRLSGP